MLEAAPPLVRAVHQVTNDEAYFTLDEYRYVYYERGWRSPLDDPDFDGTDVPTPPESLTDLRFDLTNLEDQVAGILADYVTTAALAAAVAAAVEFMNLGRSRMQVSEDFAGSNITTGQIGKLGWDTGASGTGAAITVMLFGGLGRRLVTGTTATGYSWLSLGANIFAGCPQGFFEWEAHLDDVVSDGTNTYAVRIGLHNGTTAAPTDGVYFEYDTAGRGNGNWWAVCINDGVATAVDTGVAVIGSESSGHDFLCAYDGAAVTFSIDGTQVATITTNVPDSSDPITPAARIAKSVGTTSRKLALRRFTINVARP